MEKYEHSNNDSRKHVPNYTERTRGHEHGAAETHTGDHLVSHHVLGRQKLAGDRAGVHLPVPALMDLPGLARTYRH